ncbi:MAG: ATP-binding protein [Gammaproteobacteria bacterium]|nr:ATP-binding protein [Gammaproteobacteria bacterium]
MKAGIQTRLLITTTLVLGTSLSLAGVVLDRSFQASIVAGAEEQLRLVIYSLMGSVDEYGDEMRFNLDFPEPRLNQPESGLYAVVDSADGDQRWRSPSMITTGVEFPADGVALGAGEFRFESAQQGLVERFFLSYAVIWEDTEEALLTFRVGTDQAPFTSAIQGFRRNLYIGLGAVTALFVLAQYLAVRWGLIPLRTMAGEVREMEEGHREQLSDRYPSELHGLAQNLDRFVAHEQRSRARYRKAMEDLAHSLKTPLAVIRNALGEKAPAEPSLLADQLDRMESSVTYQLSRASATGPVVVGRIVNAATMVERLVRALQTAYSERAIDVVQDIPADLNVRGDERDLMEMLGNLLENAFKYTSSQVRIHGEHEEAVAIIIEDDGPGIEPELREQVLNRGTRADQVQSGQGIGLSVVAELVALYRGRLDIGASAMGGARIRLELPG